MTKWIALAGHCHRSSSTASVEGRQCCPAVGREPKYHTALAAQVPDNRLRSKHNVLIGVAFNSMLLSDQLTCCDIFFPRLWENMVLQQSPNQCQFSYTISNDKASHSHCWSCLLGYNLSHRPHARCGTQNIGLTH